MTEADVRGTEAPETRLCAVRVAHLAVGDECHRVGCAGLKRQSRIPRAQGSMPKAPVKLTGGSEMRV